MRLQYEIETQHRRKDGTSFPVNTYFSADNGRGPNQRTFITVTVDISARRAAEDALRAAQSEMGRVARLTTMGAMAATIAHELNQPLAAIVSNGNAGLVGWIVRSRISKRPGGRSGGSLTRVIALPDHHKHRAMYKRDRVRDRRWR